MKPEDGTQPRTRIHANGFTCGCGYAELFEQPIAANESGPVAAAHIAFAHPRNRTLGHAGCVDCECQAIFEPVVMLASCILCEHASGRHDAFCSVVDCPNVIERSGAERSILGTRDIVLLCERHLADNDAEGEQRTQ